MIIGGWIVYALIYLGFAVAKSPTVVWFYMSLMGCITAWRMAQRKR